jgi:hypothetical protein
MVPFPMLETRSAAERRLYEGFLEQLDGSFVVYHSVDWVLGPERSGAAVEQGEADFVVVHPELGMLVLEAKGGSLAYDPGTRRWSQTGRDGSHALDEDPFHQANDAMHSLVRILGSRRGWADWMPSYGFGLVCPDTRYDHDAHPGAPAAIAIDGDDLERLDERVREVMAYWHRPGRRFGQRGMNEVASAFGFRFEVVSPLKVAFDQEDRRIVELTEDQAYVRAVVLHKRRTAVFGPAGSGKTLLATGVAQHVAATGARTLLVCFNWRLAGHLQQTVGDTPNLDVFHFHGLCRAMAQEAGLAVPAADGPDDRTTFEERMPEVLMEAAERLGPRYDAIVVDEAQDVRPHWWPALLALHHDPDGGRLYLFADEGQNLYEGGDFPIDPEDVLPPLAENRRNTRAINAFVSVFAETPEGRATRGKGPPGQPVQVFDYIDHQGLLALTEDVVENLLAEGLGLEDLVVLTPAGATKSVLMGAGAAGRYPLSTTPRKDHLLWSSVHAFKGLERSVVILAEIGERHADETPDRFLYVGGSRAVHHLIVLATPEAARAIRRRAGVERT